MKRVIIISTIVVSILASCKQNSESEKSFGIDNYEKFKGTWQLQKWTAELANNEVVYPYGEDANGIITYDKYGNMAVQVMKNQRTPFISEDPLNAQAEEVWDAYNGFIAYSGSYEVDTSTNKVTHSIKLSSFPNWVGQNQIRHFEFEEDQLVLSTDVIGSSRHKLIWKRLNN